MILAQVAVTPSVARIPPHPFSLFYRMWPVAVLGVALIFNVVWMSFLDSNFSSWYSNMRHAGCCP